MPQKVWFPGIANCASTTHNSFCIFGLHFQECESRQDEQSQNRRDEGKVLRSGRKIESAPSSQDDDDEGRKKTKLEDLVSH